MYLQYLDGIPRDKYSIIISTSRCWLIKSPNHHPKNQSRHRTSADLPSLPPKGNAGAPLPWDTPRPSGNIDSVDQDSSKPGPPICSVIEELHLAGPNVRISADALREYVASRGLPQKGLFSASGPAAGSHLRPRETSSDSTAQCALQAIYLQEVCLAEIHANNTKEDYPKKWNRKEDAGKLFVGPVRRSPRGSRSAAR